MAGFFNAVTVRFSLRLSTAWSQRAHGGEAGRADWFAMRARMLRARMMGDWLAVAIARNYFATLDETAAREIARGGQRPFHLAVTRGFITIFRRVQGIGYNCPPFIARFLRRHILPRPADAVAAPQ